MPRAEAAPCELLSWDSEFWGFPIGRVHGETLTPERLADVEEWARAEAIHCLYFLARTDDPATVRLAENAGFRLVDIRVTLTRRRGAPIPRPRRRESPISVRELRSEDGPTLIRIARESYRMSRFYSDGRFPQERCADLYQIWTEKSIDGSADVVLVAEADGAPVGYITCDINDGRIGWISLIAVEPGPRAQGAALELSDAAIAWFERNGARRVEGATQGRNLAAIRILERYGFLFKKLELWFHKWYDEQGRATAP
jgi:dTDP-4-amino-4,6-dideoxy-D-galactose acyltransferase